MEDKIEINVIGDDNIFIPKSEYIRWLNISLKKYEGLEDYEKCEEILEKIKQVES